MLPIDPETAARAQRHRPAPPAPAPATAPAALYQFTCDPAWKRLVHSRAAARGLKLRALAITAISRYLEIPE